MAKEPDAAQLYAGHLTVAVRLLFSAVNCSHDWSVRSRFTARADAVPLASLELYVFTPAVNTAKCMWYLVAFANTFKFLPRNASPSWPLPNLHQHILNLSLVQQMPSLFITHIVINLTEKQL